MIKILVNGRWVKISGNDLIQYLAGNGIQISSNHTISIDPNVVQSKLTSANAGNNITITNVEGVPKINSTYTYAINLENGSGLNSVQQTASDKSIEYDNDYYTIPQEYADKVGAIGKDSFTANGNSIAVGLLSSAFGRGSMAMGERSHAEGTKNAAIGANAHCEGSGSCAETENTHAEGMYTYAKGIASHTEGFKTKAEGLRSHAEGDNTKTVGQAAHAEGSNGIATGAYSHVEGQYSESIGISSHAEGSETTSSGRSSHAEGSNTTSEGVASHAEGSGTKSSGANSHAEGSNTESYGDNAHSEGYTNKSYGGFSHTEGYNTYTGKREFTVDRYNIDKPTPPAPPVPEGTRWQLKDVINIAADGAYQGQFQIVNNDTVFNYIVTNAANGTINYQVGRWWSQATDIQVFKNGAWLNSSYKTVYVQSTTDALTAWLEANKKPDVPPVIIYASSGHAEGYKTQAIKGASHSEGNNTVAAGSCSHAEGWLTEANGDFSHASGKYTTANGYAQTVVGKYNVAKSDNVLFIVGNGSSRDNFSNAFEVYTDGHAEVQSGMKIVNGNLQIGNTTLTEAQLQALLALLN